MSKKSKEKTPEQKAKMKMSSIKNQIRNCLASGDEKKAFALLARNGIQDILECRLPIEYQSDAEPWFGAYVARITPPETVEQPHNGGSKDIFSPEVVATMPVSVTPEPVAGDLTPLEGQDIAFPANEPRIEENEAPAEPEITLKEPSTLTEADFVGGWPRRAVAKFWGTVRNPKLIIMLLPDNRKVSCYRSPYRQLRNNEEVTIELEASFASGERKGDPIYEIISKRNSIW